MRRGIASLVGLVAATIVLVSCGEDARRGTLPTGPAGPSGRQSDITPPGTCTTLANLVALTNTVFANGSPNVSSVLGKLNALDQALQAGDLATAQADAQTIISFVQLKAAQGTLTATHAQVQALLSGVSCYAGLSPDTFLILPSDLAQVVRANGGQSGISLQPNTVNVPTLVTITVLTTPPLETQLDQYPGFIHITQSSPLTKPAVVAVCPAPTGIPAEVLARLRLGHQATPGAAGFEVTPRADASFLVCSTPTVPSLGQSRIGGWLQRLASLVTPKPLYAKVLEDRSGVGGLVSEFSPFGPVDPELNLRGGVGGLVSEFRKAPPTGTGRVGSPAPASPKAPGGLTPSTSRAPDARVNTVVNGVCTQIDAIFGNSVEAACRPAVTITTFQGTVIQGVPVAWAIAQGGGVVAPQTSVDPNTPCGTFGSTASTTTDASGSASVCWNLGTVGTNKVTATPSVGGLPAGVFFSSTNVTFTAVANPITPTAGATGGTFPYDGSGHAGAGTCSNGLTPALSYTGGVLVPTDAGTYTLTVTCGAGNPLYVTVSQPATIVITPAATTTTITCPASAVYTGSSLTPCTASVSGPGLSQSVTPTYSGNVNVGTATVNASYPAAGNYAGSTASAATFQVTPALTTTVVTCAGPVTFTGSAQTPCSAVANGPGLTNVPVTPTYVANVNAGTATANAAYLAGGNYLGSTGSATFTINRAPTVAAITCPTTPVTFTGSAVSPCSGSVSGPLLAQSVTPTYTSNLVGLATATVNYPGAANYLPSSISATFRIWYVQSGCFASPIFSVMPPTKSFQNKGSNVPLKCALLTAQGVGVSNAKGDLVVEDRGLDGAATLAIAFSRANAFTASSSGNYSYGLDTSPSGFVSKHYYLVTATWSDGSTSTGWFYIK